MVQITEVARLVKEFESRNLCKKQFTGDIAKKLSIISRFRHKLRSMRNTYRTLYPDYTHKQKLPSIKKLRGITVIIVVIENLSNFLSISPNQTKFLSSVCLVPRLDFSAIPVSTSAESLGRLSTYILFRF